MTHDERLTSLTYNDGMKGLTLRLVEAIICMCKMSEGLGIVLPSLSGHRSSHFWNQIKQQPRLIELQETAIETLEELLLLLRGPHEYVHELVATNWDHGALYAFLRSGILEFLNTRKTCDKGRQPVASLSTLQEISQIPTDKLSRILGLLKCRHVVVEVEVGVFGLGMVGDDLAKNEDFRAWVEFQLYETRIASAHLSDALACKPNEYCKGKSGFLQGFQMEMYDWHEEQPEKGERFKKAMRGVSKGLDPADSLLQNAFDQWRRTSLEAKAVEIGGRYGFASLSLAEQCPSAQFEVRCDADDLLQRGRKEWSGKGNIVFTKVSSTQDSFKVEDSSTTLTYVIRNVLWNWTDDAAVELLQSFMPALRATPSARILITDGLSPTPEDHLPHHLELAFRRRDITTMTMHNQKQRTQNEWISLFHKIDDNIKVKSSFERSSHVLKGMWELSLEMY